MGGSDTTQTTQSQQVTQLPPWINQAAQQNYAQAQNVATQPLQQYQGAMVAGVAPQQAQAWNLAASGGNAGADQYNAAQAAYMGVLGATPLSVNASPVNTSGMMVTAPGAYTPQTVTPSQVTAGQLSNTNLAPYMDPYTSSVINATLPIMQQNLGLQQVGNQSEAAGAGAFGGSRLGVQQGVTQAQGALGMGQMAAQLNQANFQQAQAAAQSDIASQLTANLANQQTGLQGQEANQQAALAAALSNNQLGLQAAMANQQTGLAGALANQQNALMSQYYNQQAQQNQTGLSLQAGQGLSGLGSQAQISQLRNFGELMAAGGAEQSQAQNQINAQMAKFAQAQGWPAQQLGVLESALGMTPYGQAQTGESQTQTQTSANPLAALQSGMQMLSGLPSALSGLGALGALSDRRLKTDIKRVGRHHSGIPIYSFRYKGDPKHYPKVTGPMAEDVEKLQPGGTSEIPGSGGRRAINPTGLGALAAPPRAAGGTNFAAMKRPPAPASAGTNFGALRSPFTAAINPRLRGALAVG
jgi:hypothetical protein